MYIYVHIHYIYIWYIYIYIYTHMLLCFISTYYSYSCFYCMLFTLHYVNIIHRYLLHYIFAISYYICMWSYMYILYIYTYYFILYRSYIIYNLFYLLFTYAHMYYTIYIYSRISYIMILSCSTAQICSGQEWESGQGRMSICSLNSLKWCNCIRISQGVAFQASFFYVRLSIQMPYSHI